MSDRTTPSPVLPVADLVSPEASVRVAAAETIAQGIADAMDKGGDDARAVVVALARACADPDERVREWVVAALESSGEPPREALPELIDLVVSPDALVAYWAVTLLGRSGAGASAAVPVLAQRLDAATPIEVRQRSAWALERMGGVAIPARTALEGAARDADPRLARLAAAALAAIDA